MIKTLLTFVLMSWSMIGLAQKESIKEEKKTRFFIAYEIGEAVFNKFQSHSGEIGLRFRNNHLLRLVHMNVNLSEQHLSSSFAKAVDGPNVKGKFFGFEAFYDFTVFRDKLYVGPSVGYYKSEYNHTILDEELKNDFSPTIGVGISYRETNLFGVKGLFTTFSIPLRIDLKPTKKTKLGETTIVGGVFDQNIWFFIGFEF
ncbi:hypothetical protein UMM65_08560 [Aureibaculum sp. 2210JD6-5]|uniref:hypothetical protein n=1 Tax=Aureibaculum sp. 2210JD6-5 TaxID=3103957 RepID=UPI002AACA01D|nr:hypothetical protein [Aureibaculum sp. 2210JD6-5]MDY7395291.1 hypothetical protein [Aureibaculum sp. 2210JD6-5]